MTPSAPPSWRDATVARAAEAIGGPWGRRAIAPIGSFWTPIRIVLALAAVTFVLGFSQKYPCSDGQWVDFKQYKMACYSDIVPLWGAEGLSDGKVPYRDHPVEYPVLIGGFMWITAELTRAWGDLGFDSSPLQTFTFINYGILALLGMLMVRATAAAAGIRPYDAAIAALSPLLVFHAFSNWDLAAMAFMALAMWAWAREQPLWCGVAIGLGTATKLYPVLLLVPLFVLAVRTRKFAPALWAAAMSAVAWLAVNVPVRQAWPQNWKKFYVFSEERPAEASTIWHIWAFVKDHGLGAGPAPYVVPNTAVAISVVIAMSAVVALGLMAPTKPRVAQLTFLAVLAFLLTTKVWSPQYSVWLVPLLALARPRWRSAILWQSCEIAVWVLTLWWLIAQQDADRGVQYPTLILVLVTRDIILLVLAGLIVREMWRPEIDVVRTDGTGVVLRDDPGGGIYDGAKDYPLLLAVPNRPLEDDPAPGPSPIVER